MPMPTTDAIQTADFSRVRAAQDAIRALWKVMGALPHEAVIVALVRDGWDQEEAEALLEDAKSAHRDYMVAESAFTEAVFANAKA